MPYITQADLDIPNDLLIQLTDDEQTGSVNNDRVNAAIADAEAEVNGYVGKYFAVPVANPPQILLAITSHITAYHLYARRPPVPDDIRDMDRDAHKMLVDISKGLMTLDVEPLPKGSPLVGGVVKGSPRVFSR